MAIPQAEKLIDKARAGARLSVDERRHCVEYMMAANPEHTNVELASLFRVDEKSIRVDKDRIRKSKAEQISNSDPGLVIADISIHCDRQIRDIEASKKHAKMGTHSYLQHCVAALDSQLKVVRALQDLGYYPKNLGNMTVDRFEYKAVVTQDGSVVSRRIDLMPGEAIDAEFAPADQPVAELESPEGEE